MKESIQVGVDAGGATAKICLAEALALGANIVVAYLERAESNCKAPQLALITLEAT